MGRESSLGIIMVPKIFTRKKCASQPFYRRVTCVHSVSETKINTNWNSMDLLRLQFFRRFKNKFNIIWHERIYWISICIHFDFRYGMDTCEWCDTAIERVRCTLFVGKSLGTIMVLSERSRRIKRLHASIVSCLHHNYKHVWAILGIMIVPKNIFVWKSDIQTFQIWIRNYSIYSKWLLMFIWKFMIFYRMQAFWLKIKFYI